jgi:glycerol uptake facilitator protein
MYRLSVRMGDEYTLGQKAVVEFIGLFSIVFFGAGAVVLDILTAPKQAGAEQFVLVGLGFGALQWTGIGIAFWAAIAIPIYLFGHVSDQHINPAVTFALWLIDRIDTRPAIVYVAAQFAGGIAGGLVFYIIHGPAAVTQASMGATLPFPGISVWEALLNEIVITFFLMVAVMAMAIDERTPTQFAGLVIGLVVGMGVMVVGNVSGASFNPARTIGPYVTNTIAGLFGVTNPALWQYVWIYILGPCVGAGIGAYFYEYAVLAPNEAAETE